MCRIERLHLTSPAVNQQKRPPLYFFHKTAWQESSDFYSDLRNERSSDLQSTTVNCHCSAVTMPIRSSSYATWSTSEFIVSVQLPLNFFAMRKFLVMAVVKTRTGPTGSEIAIIIVEPLSAS